MLSNVRFSWTLTVSVHREELHIMNGEKATAWSCKTNISNIYTLLSSCFCMISIIFNHCFQLLVWVYCNTQGMKRLSASNIMTVHSIVPIFHFMKWWITQVAITKASVCCVLYNVQLVASTYCQHPCTVLLKSTCIAGKKKTEWENARGFISQETMIYIQCPTLRRLSEKGGTYLHDCLQWVYGYYPPLVTITYSPTENLHECSPVNGTCLHEYEQEKRPSNCSFLSSVIWEFANWMCACL